MQNLRFSGIIGEQHVCDIFAEIAQLVEHVHGKDGVAGSIPALGSEDQQIFAIRYDGTVAALAQLVERGYRKP